MQTASSRNLDGIAAASRVLLAPLDYPSVADWQRATNAALKPLLGADKASFFLPMGDRRLEISSDEYSPAMLRDYAANALSVADRRWQVRRRTLALGAWSREELYGAQLREMYASAYWHETLLPNRAFDAIGLTAAAADAGGPVNLYLHHDSPRGPRFGEKGVMLLRALLPSFRAGVKTAVSLMAHRRSLGAVLDAIGVAVVLGDGRGVVLHRNAAFAHLLAALPPDGQAALEFVVRRVLRSSRPSTVHEVDLHGARYRLTVGLATAGNLSAGDAVVMTVERGTARTAPAIERSVGSARSLTMRETQVAELLAQGRRNAEIARALSMSEATARHHTERVMAKLGVHSRAAVAFTLARMRGEPIS